MIEYKHDGDGKVFYEDGNKVVWVCECIIDNAQGVVNILNEAQQKIAEAEKTIPNSAMDAICGQKLSCRFQHFADKIRCGAPSVIDCRHKQHQ